MLDTGTRTIFDEEHEMFRDAVRKFYAKEIVPNLERWEQAGVVEPSTMKKLGDAGFLCPTVPEAYGGLGLDFRAEQSQRVIPMDAVARVDAVVAIYSHSDPFVLTL